jgi:hypothetical protein
MSDGVKFRKKPVVIEVIEAIQFTGDDSVEKMLDQWGFKFQRVLSSHQVDGYLNINALHWGMSANINDWIIRGVKGEFYPIENDIFLEKYEAVEG